MGKFSNLTITEKGRMLLADVQAGGELDATRLVMGSGDIPAGKTPATMTAVVSEVISMQVSSKERTPDGKVVFGGYYSNTALTTDFYFKEFALFARAIYRDESGAVIRTTDEVLYSYGNAGSEADLIPAYTTGEAVEKQLEMVSYVGSETKVNLTIESDIYVAKRVFDAHAARHAAGGADAITPASIGAAPGGFGLGTQGAKVANNDANNALLNGWYQCDVNTPTNRWCDILVVSLDSFSVTQFAFDRYQNLGGNAAYYWMRTKRNDYDFTAWEIVNPPMTAGEEYRTTERIDGKIVYKKNVDGIVYYRLDGQTSWKVYAQVVGAALSDHTHDGRYYTETEVNRLLETKAPFPTWGTEDIIAGSASSSPTGTVHYVID